MLCSISAVSDNDVHSPIYVKTFTSESASVIEADANVSKFEPTVPFDLKLPEGYQELRSQVKIWHADFALSDVTSSKCFIDYYLRNEVLLEGDPVRMKTEIRCYAPSRALLAEDQW